MTQCTLTAKPLASGWSSGLGCQAAIAALALSREPGQGCLTTPGVVVLNLFNSTLLMFPDACKDSARRCSLPRCVSPAVAIPARHSHVDRGCGR